MLLALYRGTPSIRFPPAAGLWEEVYNLARMLASDRRLTWAAGSMPSKKCDLGQVKLLGTSLLPES